MNNQLGLKLWVIKFTLNVIYPKLNYFLFLVYLAIKYRIHFNRSIKATNNMNTLKLKAISCTVQRLLLANAMDNDMSIYYKKCLIVSKDKFIELAVENLFYLDHGMLWMAIKIKDPKNISSKSKHSSDRVCKNDVNFGTTEIHKKLWSIDNKKQCERVCIVPIVGSKKVVNDNIIMSTEIEYHNLLSSFGLNGHEKDVEVVFHPVPSLKATPKIAVNAEVNFLVNEFDLTTDFLKEILSNYFALPKLISLNDVFSIELTPEIAGNYHYKYLNLVQSTERLYFKCTKISHDKVANQIEDGERIIGLHDLHQENTLRPSFIVKDVTQLSLGENMHFLKPKDEYFQHKDTISKITLLDACPYGLRKKFDEIQDTIRPFLVENLNDILSSLASPIIPMLLLMGSTGSGRHLLVKLLAKYNGMNFLHIDCNGLQSSTAKQTEFKINATVQSAKTASPVIVVLDNFEVFAVDPENNEDCRVVEYFVNTITALYQNYTKHPIIFIAVTESTDLKPNILRIFLDKFHIPKLTHLERLEMLQWFSNIMDLEFNDVPKSTNSKCINFDENKALDKETNDILQRIAAKTETFLYGDMDTLIHFALRESYLDNHCYNESFTGNSLGKIKEEHFNLGLESMRSLQSQHLDAPKIPKIYWDDIGGLDKLKKELLKTIELPIKYPHLFKNSNLKRSGILLYGPPGCGKTLVAKAVSTELNVSFLSVKGPELLNMYIGQSEENVRKVFESARASSPCIVFLDELDALAPRRGAAGDSGGASDRVVSQLLAELDGVASTQDSDTTFVFIMGATNRPDLLERSLLRPGRLDKLIYVGPYCGLQEKHKVLTALCRSHNLRPEVNLEDVAAALPDRCTGADLLQVVSIARSAAVRALLDKVKNGLVKEKDLNTDSVMLGVSELWEGVQSFRPSVTDEEMLYYESLQSQL